MASKLATVAVLASLAFPVGVAGQNLSTAKLAQSVDKGPSLGAFGTRVSFFFGGTNALRTGFEVGYAGLGGAEEGLPAGNNPGVAAVEWASSNRNMYHATFSARHNFMSTGPAGLYAGAGTGIYAVRNINEFWQQLPGSSNRLDYERSTNLAFNLGLNFGGGIEVRPLRSLGAVDLDARFHFLPFNSAANVRSVFIFSAGLRIF